ncbi:MAG: RNA polymerase sigma-70 factor [Proteiniphilum sp.]|jgi:RNA polymerase sigma-70 factor (ECF subfamily)|nr:RNA polymerase sigma-70 factor [Proteiniphilum sp.]
MDIGDDSSFSKLFVHHQQGFIRFADSYVRNRAVAEDFVIDAWLYFWENRHKLPEDTNVPAYVLTIVKNKCLSYLRHLQIQEQVISQIHSNIRWEMQMRITRLEDCEPYQVFTREIQELVAKAISRLSEQTQTVFRLSRVQQLSGKEIAEKLGISIKTVEFHVTKATKTLRKELKDYW